MRRRKRFIERAEKSDTLKRTVQRLNKVLFPDTLEQATHLQRTLADRVVCRDDLPSVVRVAGADISHNPRDPSHVVHAAFAVLSLDQQIITTVGATGVAKFPYVPGYLGFREVPTLVQAYAALSPKPDLVFVDGHGISHPRGLGIAMALRTRRRTRPVYVSVGHRVSLETAVAWVQRMAAGYRLPEPTRQAHLAANKLRTKK